jgi:hypothetical protein
MDPPRSHARNWTRSTNAVDYELEELRAMKDLESGRFSLLDFSNCPIASIDNLFPFRKNFGLLEPPLLYRANAKSLREWRRLGKRQQKSKVESEDPAKDAAHKRSRGGRLQRQNSRRRLNKRETHTTMNTDHANVTPTPMFDPEDNAADDAVKGAALGAVTEADTDDFASDTVPLVGEGEADKGGGIEILVRAGERIEASVSDKQLDILQ